MNFPFNFFPPQFPPFFNNNNSNSHNNNFQQNDNNFFSNNFFGQPFFNNPANHAHNPDNLDQINSFQNTNTRFNQSNSSPPKTSNKSKKNNEKSSENLKVNHSELLKNLGNDCFKVGDYTRAIEYYTKAIEKDGNQATYFLNRAICFKYLKKFNETMRDCNLAIELDDQNYKAYLLLGRTLAEMAKSDNNTEKIRKALTKIEKAIKNYALFNQNQSEKIMKELKTYFRRAQKLLWYKIKEFKKAQNSEIYSYINDSLTKDGLTEENKTEMLKNLEMVVLNPYKNEESNYIVPDEYCCKISLDIMDEPFLCPSGISYEGSILFEHLKTHDFDPVTREPLAKHQIFPNLTLKMAIDNYISQNPWAFESVSKENYISIDF